MRSLLQANEYNLVEFYCNLKQLNNQWTREVRQIYMSRQVNQSHHELKGKRAEEKTQPSIMPEKDFTGMGIDLIARNTSIKLVERGKSCILWCNKRREGYCAN